MTDHTLHVGFSGTQDGMTPIQRATVSVVLMEAVLGNAGFPVVLHHGDCIGADEEAHELAGGMEIDRHAHPPDKDVKRAFTVAEFSEPPKPYRVRNQDIVDVTKQLVAAPSGAEADQPRSGTWMTVRMARRAGLTVTIVTASGVIHREPAGVR